MIDVDGAYSGGIDSGGKRGLGSKKQTVLIGVEMVSLLDPNPEKTREFPARARIKLVESENGEDIVQFLKGSVEPGSIIRGDGATALKVLKQTYKTVESDVALKEDGSSSMKCPYTLDQHPFDKSEGRLEYVHKFISKAKSLIEGIYHGVNLQYLDLFLEEFTWRWNHRTEQSNFAKMKVLLQTIFQTKVVTAKQFKQNYATL